METIRPNARAINENLARLHLRPASMEEWVRLASHSVALPRFAGRAVLTGENLTHYRDFWAVKTARAVVEFIPYRAPGNGEPKSPA